VTEPMQQFLKDRDLARERADPWANLCATASVDLDGHPSVRTLVLRDVEGRLGLFCNTSSPKWQHFASAERVSVLAFWATINVQYRLCCSTRPMEPAVVQSAWQQRPPAPKHLDWYYAHGRAQSTPVESREHLLAELQDLTLPEPLEAPAGASGVYLEPFHVDRLDLNQPNGFHDRRRYRRSSSDWVEEVLVP
jgi:pyridoxamine 5'-phosphate oxidase